MQGTEVILHGATDEDIQQAKSLFMAFSNENVIETTTYGQIENLLQIPLGASEQHVRTSVAAIAAAVRRSASSGKS